MRGIEGTVRSRGLRPLVTAGLAVVAVIGGGAAARAEEPPAFSVVFPAGLACPAFDLRVDGFGDGPEVFRTFSDRDGNIVRALTAGTGFALVFTNETTRETFSSRANGAVAHTRFNPDGSQTQVLTGHNIVILFPTDTPPGPRRSCTSGAWSSTSTRSVRSVCDNRAGQPSTYVPHSSTELNPTTTSTTC